MRILLWLVVLVMLFVLALLINMELNIAKHGGWEMAEGIGFVFGLLFIVYYSIVLVLGRLMLRRGGPSWGWFFVALTAILVAVPVFFVWWLRV